MTETLTTPTAAIPRAGAHEDYRQETAGDLDRLSSACAMLRRHGISTAVAQQGPEDQIAARLIGAIRSAIPSADGACVFWSAEDHSRSLDPAGRLRRPLTVHTRGPGVAEAARAAFERAGLVVSPGASSEVIIVESPTPAHLSAGMALGVEVTVEWTGSRGQLLSRMQEMGVDGLRLAAVDPLQADRWSCRFQSAAGSPIPPGTATAVLARLEESGLGFVRIERLHASDDRRADQGR